MRHRNGSSPLMRAGVVCMALGVGAPCLGAGLPAASLANSVISDDQELSMLCQLRRKLGLPCDLSNTAPMEEYYLAVEEAYLQTDLDALSFDERADLILQILVVQASQSPMPEHVDPGAYERFMRMLDIMLLELEA